MWLQGWCFTGANVIEWRAKKAEPGGCLLQFQQAEHFDPDEIAACIRHKEEALRWGSDPEIDEILASSLMTALLDYSQRSQPSQMIPFSLTS
uniref:Uncharacterized protein n=1 Tax=Nelumbo nucifera TaxID=4432 RepID=A0A822ZEL5_NELNU|nr:TPA_asm: hypothetical protein HUJ06_016168 [Nelumbo nucifera]